MIDALAVATAGFVTSTPLVPALSIAVEGFLVAAQPAAKVGVPRARGGGVRAIPMAHPVEPPNFAEVAKLIAAALGVTMSGGSTPTRVAASIALTIDDDSGDDS